MPASNQPAVFDTQTEVDFVIIGSGASGGILAKELSTSGFSVLVLEQGPYRKAGDFSHDEMKVMLLDEMTSHPLWQDPQTYRQNASQKAAVKSRFGPPPALYARGVPDRDQCRRSSRCSRICRC